MLRFTLTTLLVFQASVLQAGMILDGVPDSLYTDFATQFPSVGKVGNSSGTLIAPQWVLTAAHISNADYATFTIGGTSYSVAQSFRHPQFLLNGANLNFGYDVALLRLNTSVTGFAPARIYTGTNELGGTIAMVGFGASGVGSAANPQNPGTKRAGTNVADTIFSFSNGTAGQIGAQDAALVTDFDAPENLNPGETYNTLGVATPTSLETQLAGFDSGGGGFIEVNGEWYLAGIHSGVASQLEWTGTGNDQRFGYGAVSVMTRVSSYESFIASISGVPEPGSLGILVTSLLLGGGGYCLRRR